MISHVKSLDRILRGELTRLEALRNGTINFSAGGVLMVIALLGVIYGVCMGTFALAGSGSGAPMQVLASGVKVPSLFLLTLLVTFPSLYVFNALVGSRLRLLANLRLLVAALGVMLAVLSSIGPIVAFFSLSTKSYPFMIVLNVVVYGVAGVLGLSFLLQTLHRLTIADQELRTPGPESAIDPVEGQMLGLHTRVVFRIWVCVFGFVGAQMSWVLRPFIGDPNQPFTWFRGKESNFFAAVWTAVQHLLH